MRNWKIGDRVADMHDGLSEFPHTVTKNIEIIAPNPSQFIESIIDRPPLNKLVYVIGENRSTGDIQAAYTYDGLRIGFIEFNPEEK